MHPGVHYSLARVKSAADASNSKVVGMEENEIIPETIEDTGVISPKCSLSQLPEFTQESIQSMISQIPANYDQQNLSPLTT